MRRKHSKEHFRIEKKVQFSKRIKEDSNNKTFNATFKNENSLARLIEVFFFPNSEQKYAHTLLLCIAQIMYTYI